MKIIVLRLEAGLGNQFFQYAFARNIQDKFGGKIIFDVRPLKRSKIFKPTLQFFLLNRDVIVNNNTFDKVLIFFLRFWYKSIKIITNTLITNRNLRKKIRAMCGLFIQETTRYEKYDYYSPVPVKYISGNWMSELYFKDVKDKVKDELALNVKLSKVIIDKAKEIESQNSVCVHIRRGDYTNAQWAPKLLVCDFNYYQRGIDFINKEVKKPVYYVFSNTHEDISWIKENFFFNTNVVYIDMNNKDFEDFFLMTHCKHFILSNSTYSWWASYLSNSQNKIIVSPKKWNNGQWDMSDIFLSYWNKL